MNPYVKTKKQSVSVKKKLYSGQKLTDGEKKILRSAETGKFVSKDDAKKNPSTTVKETRSTNRKKS